jgi:hypothetical protein
MCQANGYRTMLAKQKEVIRHTSATQLQQWRYRRAQALSPGAVATSAIHCADGLA